MIVTKSVIKTTPHVFSAFLENSGNELTPYTFEVHEDKLIVKKLNTNKVKLELELNSMAPLSYSNRTILSNNTISD